MTVMKYMSWLTTCSVFTALFSIIYQAFWSLKKLNTITIVLTGLMSLENYNRSENFVRPKIAVGYGSCSDLIVSATHFLNYTGDIPLDIGPNFSVDDVTNEDEFIQSFAYYFQNGAAAERFTPDDKLFKRLITTAKTKLKGQLRWSLGGNAPMMGTRFFKEGADVLLAARMSEKLRSHLPEQVQIAGDLVEDDDIHLILEYKSGETWGPYTAPRANRYILHNDQNNPKISSLELLDDVLTDFGPRLLVVSGLQMMDSYKFLPGVREARLTKVQNQIASQPKSTLIHFEMASYVEIELLKLLLTHVIPRSDSIGMNEQELDNLQQVLKFDKIRFASDSNPRVATALDQMREVFIAINEQYFKTEQSSGATSKRMLSRLHVHTLAYQAILVVKGSAWKHTKNAAAKAALTAHRHVCATETVNPELSNLILDESFATSKSEKASTFQKAVPERIKIDPKNPVPCWEETIEIAGNSIAYEICVAPVLVCRIAKQTAGAGDNISASGLVIQI